MREHDAVGILFANMHDNRLGRLTEQRTMGSVPFGGRYRLIDFMLSNLVNAGISDVGVIAKRNYQSLMDHLGTGKAWDLSRKRGGLCFLSPFSDSGSGIYHGRIAALDSISGYLQSISAKYVILSDCDLAANIDLSNMLEQHISSGAEISVLYQNQLIEEEHRSTAVALELGESGAVKEIFYNPPVGEVRPVYLSVLILEKDLLLRLIARSISYGMTDFERDVIGECCRHGQVRGIEFCGTCCKIDSVQSYFDESLKLLEPSFRDGLFLKDRPIYTKIRDEVPVKYGLSSQVSNSLVADGCVIEGEVYNSILFRGVRIGKGAVVKNSIVMQGSFVGDRASLDHVVADKDVFITPNRHLAGCESYPFYIVKAARV